MKLMLLFLKILALYTWIFVVDPFIIKCLNFTLAINLPQPSFFQAWDQLRTKYEAKHRPRQSCSCYMNGLWHPLR